MNVLYPSYKDGLLNSNFNWVTDDLKIALYTVATAYNPLHTLLGDLGGIQVSPGEDSLINKSTQDGFARSFPASYEALLSPETVAVAIMYKASNDQLMAYMDAVNGFVFNPSGANYTFNPGGPDGSWFTL